VRLSDLLTVQYRNIENPAQGQRPVQRRSGNPGARRLRILDLTRRTSRFRNSFQPVAITIVSAPFATPWEFRQVKVVSQRLLRWFVRHRSISLRSHACQKDGFASVNAGDSRRSLFGLVGNKGGQSWPPASRRARPQLREDDFEVAGRFR